MTHNGKIKSYDSGKGAGNDHSGQGRRCPAVQQVWGLQQQGLVPSAGPAFRLCHPSRCAASAMPHLQMEQGSGDSARTAGLIPPPPGIGLRIRLLRPR